MPNLHHSLLTKNVTLTEFELDIHLTVSDPYRNGGNSDITDYDTNDIGNDDSFDHFWSQVVNETQRMDQWLFRRTRRGVGQRGMTRRTTGYELRGSFGRTRRGAGQRGMRRRTTGYERRESFGRGRMRYSN